MLFTKSKSFGPKISLTDRQADAVEKLVRDAGLTCWVDNCHTGSCYIAIDLPTWDRDINGCWYNDLDCGCNDGVAKIRLSGHDEGQRTDSTYNCVGPKTLCLKTMKRWIGEIIVEYGAAGRAILANQPNQKS